MNTGNLPKNAFAGLSKRKPPKKKALLDMAQT
jgi:hypothetical protein